MRDILLKSRETAESRSRLLDETVKTWYHVLTRKDSLKGQRESFSGTFSVLGINRERIKLMEALQMNGTIEDVINREDHAELIDGKLIISDKATISHNNAVVEITSSLKQFIKSSQGNCKVFAENAALYCNELCDSNNNFFLPDVMTVCDETGIKEDGIHVAPVFVAEVTSESTKKQDYGRKMVVYGEIGVQEYWVVDLQRKVILRYLSKNDFVPELISYPNTRFISVYSYPGLDIDLTGIFD